MIAPSRHILQGFLPTLWRAVSNQWPAAQKILTYTSLSSLDMGALLKLRLQCIYAMTSFCPLNLCHHIECLRLFSRYRYDRQCSWIPPFQKIAHSIWFNFQIPLMRRWDKSKFLFSLSQFKPTSVLKQKQIICGLLIWSLLYIPLAIYIRWSRSSQISHLIWFSVFDVKGLRHDITTHQIAGAALLTTHAFLLSRGQSTNDVACNF